MKNKKNILIAVLVIVILVQAWIIFDLSYGRYCVPVIREPVSQQEQK